MKVHQNVVINGVDYGVSKRRKESKFFNEGKWNNYILPLLPKDCREMTFVEIGCNGGLYLKMAKNYGFRNVVGLEMNKEAYAVASEYMIGDARIIHSRLVEQFDYSVLPAADVVLMANVHYHLSYSTFLRFVDVMRRKTRYIILVAALVNSRRHCPKTDIESVRKYFRFWKELQYIPPLNKEGDPWPRDVYSFLFESEIKRIPIKQVLDPLFASVKYRRYYKATKRKSKELNRRYPFTIPILIEPSGVMIDGVHKFVTLEEEGYKTVLAEFV